MERRRSRPVGRSNRCAMATSPHADPRERARKRAADASGIRIRMERQAAAACRRGCGRPAGAVPFGHHRLFAGASGQVCALRALSIRGKLSVREAQQPCSASEAEGGSSREAWDGRKCLAHHQRIHVQDVHPAILITARIDDAACHHTWLHACMAARPQVPLPAAPDGVRKRAASSDDHAGALQEGPRQRPRQWPARQQHLGRGQRAAGVAAGRCRKQLAGQPAPHARHQGACCQQAPHPLAHSPHCMGPPPWWIGRRRGRCALPCHAMVCHLEHWVFMKAISGLRMAACLQHVASERHAADSRMQILP